MSHKDVVCVTTSDTQMNTIFFPKLRQTVENGNGKEKVTQKPLTPVMEMNLSIGLEDKS